MGIETINRLIELLLKITQEIQNISFESIITYYFTVLGIFVTLVSISTALNREIRQKLLVKYLSGDRFIQIYLLYLLGSFLYVFSSLIFNLPFEKEILILIIFILFLISLVFIIYFISSLNREHFNKLILKRTDTFFRKGDYKKLPEPLVDFISNIGYVQKNNIDFDEEERAFEKLVEKSIRYNKTNMIVDLIDRIQIISPSLFDTFLHTLYRLRFRKQITFRKSFIYQDILSRVIFNAFRNTNEFRPKLNTSGLYIKEFFDIRLLETFEKTTNDMEINDFEMLAKNTINSLYNLNKLIIDLNLPEDIKKQYLSSQLAELNKSMQHIDHYSETDFCEEYYDYKFKETHEEEVKLVEKKLILIRNLLHYLQDKKSELFFLILHEINTGKLSKNFFEITMKIYYSKGFQEKFIKTPRFDMLDGINYDSFDGGVQTIPRFNFSKYKLLILLHEYLKEKSSIEVFQKLENEHFNDTTNPFASEIKSIDKIFVDKYFEITDSNLKSFKKDMQKELKKKLKEIKLKEEKHKTDSEAKEQYVAEFKLDFLKVWNNNQETLGKFIQIESVVGGEDIKTHFGRYTLDPKEWFLDSFYRNVAMARDTGTYFANSQIKSKNKNILEQFLQNKIKKEDIILVRKSDLINGLKRLVKSNKTYYFVYSWKNLKLYSLQNITWKRDGLVEAEIKINNSKIKFINIDLEEKNLLFEEKAIVLKQFSRGYEDNDKPLFIDVDDKFTRKEMEKIIESDANNLKTQKDVKKLVKIRIAEKFKIQRDNKKDAFEIRFE